MTKMKNVAEEINTSFKDKVSTGMHSQHVHLLQTLHVCVLTENPQNGNSISYSS